MDTNFVIYTDDFTDNVRRYFCDLEKDGQPSWEKTPMGIETYGTLESAVIIAETLKLIPMGVKVNPEDMEFYPKGGPRVTITELPTVVREHFKPDGN